MKYVISVIIILAVLFGIQSYINRAKVVKTSDSVISEALNKQQTMDKVATSTGSTETLGIIDTKVGTGKEAKAGDTITVNYTGKFTNGQVFDSSIPRGEPFVFKLGAGMVIKGWDQGFAGMKEGGKRILTVPPMMGYGMNDYHTIPGGSTLIFDIELLKVE